jgi:hypothetical protein
VKILKTVVFCLGLFLFSIPVATFAQGLLEGNWMAVADVNPDYPLSKYLREYLSISSSEITRIEAFGFQSQSENKSWQCNNRF